MDSFSKIFKKYNFSILISIYLTCILLSVSILSVNTKNDSLEFCNNLIKFYKKQSSYNYLRELRNIDNKNDKDSLLTKTIYMKKLN